MLDERLGGFLSASLAPLTSQLDDADRLILTKALELLAAIAAKTATTIDDTILGFLAGALQECGFDGDDLDDFMQTMKPERIQSPEQDLI